MINSLLLPHWLRKVGLVLLPIAIILLIAVFMYDYSIPFLNYGSAKVDTSPFDIRNKDWSDELAILMTFFCLFAIAFSKEKQEDEYLQEVRLRALQLSVYANYIVLVLGVVFIYGLSFLYVLYGNLFTILIIFILVYYYQIHIKPKLSKSEAL